MSTRAAHVRLPRLGLGYGRPSIERAGGKDFHLSTEIPKAYVPREVQEEAVLTRMTDLGVVMLFG